ESASYYYRNRAFSPTVGRFTEQDPIGTDETLYNNYEYTNNEPVNYIDPMGLFQEGPPSGQQQTRPLQPADLLYGDEIQYELLERAKRYIQKGMLDEALGKAAMKLYQKYGDKEQKIYMNQQLGLPYPFPAPTIPPVPHVSPGPSIPIQLPTVPMSGGG